MTDQRNYNQRLIEEFREARSRTDKPLDGRPLLLLTTTGARSGLSRTTPLMYIPDDKRLLIVASNAGAASHPDWYRNIVAHPQVTIEVGPDTFEATATIAEGSLRQQLWDRITTLYPFFVDHQTKITRQIPIIVLERRTR